MARGVFAPFAQDGFGFEPAFLAQPRGVEQRIGPFAQRPAQPGGEWHGEAALGAVHQRLRHMAMQHLAQQPFTGVAAHLVLMRQAPGKFIDAVVDERHARLQAHRHGGAIHLDQDVVGQIGDRVQLHHGFEGRALHVAREFRHGFHAALDHLRGVGPVRHEVAVEVAARIGAQQLAQLADLAAPGAASGQMR
ncbi:hypothetical protein D3C73_1064550 [compost metagenome]